MQGTERHEIIKCDAEGCRRTEDLVAQEKRLRISINGQEALSLYCSPFMVRELVVGLVATEGIAEGICMERMGVMYGQDEITVEVHADGPVRTEGASVTSGCVGGLTFKKEITSAALADKFSISPQGLLAVFRRFQRKSALYDQTGCIHSAALANADEILCFAEDIGRHNAVDKVIGSALMEKIGFAGTMMLASGRLSSEIVSKCARWAIPMVVSRTAPTALSLEIARQGGVTVIGFARGERFNIYTHPERVEGA